MGYARTEYRLKTAVDSIVITEPQVIVTPTIAEPVNWSNIDLVGEVDELFHGFNYNYAKGDISLIFTCESAGALIAQQYNRYGVDAVVQFLVIEIDRDLTEHVVYDGKINYAKGFELEDGWSKATVVLNSIHTKVVSRWDSKIDLTANRTLDDVLITPPLEIELPLNGQTLHEEGQTQIQRKRVEIVTFPSPGLGGVFFILPNMLPMKDVSPVPNTSISTIPALETLAGTHLLYGSVTAINPDSNPLLDVTNDTAGLYRIELEWQFTVNVSLTKKSLQIGAPRFVVLNFSPVVVVRQPGKTDVITAIAPALIRGGFINSVEEGFNCKYAADLDLPSGSQVFWYCKVPSFTKEETKQQEFTITTYNLRAFIKRDTRTPASRAKAYGLSEALRHVFGCVTSTIDQTTGSGLVVGGLLDAASSSQAFDGFARELAVTTGIGIRGLSNKPPKFSLKELMLFLSAQTVAGMLYEKDPITGEETVRVEEGSWFYRGEQIMLLDEVYEYSETPDTDQLYNKIKVGYEKFPTSGAGIGEEFNTTRTYQTPLINSDQTLTIESPLIAAGTAIEQQRRMGSKKIVDGVEVSNENDAGPYDDDAFVFHVINQVNTDSITFIAEGPTPQKPYLANYIQFSSSVISRLYGGVTLKAGDVIVINGTGTAYDGGAYIILNVIGNRATLNPKYQVFFSGFVNSGPHVGTWQLAGQPFKLRTNERLNVQGLTDPPNVLNQELSPARTLRRWSRFINSGLFYKKATDVLRCTEYKGNGVMMSQVKVNEMPLPGDPYRQAVWETKDTALGELEKFDKLFRPELINVKLHMTRDQQKALFDAMQNRGPEEKRLGYIGIKRPEDGVIVGGYVRQITYNKSSQVATMTLRKRKLVLSLPSCNYYYDWQLNRLAIDPTANPQNYMFCQFKQLQPV